MCRKCNYHLKELYARINALFDKISELIKKESDTASGKVIDEIDEIVRQNCPDIYVPRYYVKRDEIPVTEDMDIGTMLDLLVDDYINNLISGYENNLRIILIIILWIEN